MTLPPQPIRAVSARPAHLRLAMLGMIPGNGHPYSWSAIINGYDPSAMAACPYSVIPQYLQARPIESVRIDNAAVTHIWTDNPAEAGAVAAAAKIPHIVSRAEDVIGEVDAVLIATDDGFDHVRRVEPFIAAGLPVFIDKPLALTIDDLRTFLAWQKKGARLMSSSGFRYAAELDALLEPSHALGDWRWLGGITCKTWERYGIHLLEPIFRLVGPGFVAVRLAGSAQLQLAHLTHRNGAEITVVVIHDGIGTFGTLHVCGSRNQTTIRITDTYTAFRRQLGSYLDFVRTGAAPYPFADTVELMSLLIAGIRSRAEGGRRVELTEISSALSS